MTLEPDYSLEEVAEAIQMSPRWIRDRIKHDGVEHIRYGHKIRFTEEQVNALRRLHTQKQVVPRPVTSGKKRRVA